MEDELIKRLADLAARCERQSAITHTAFLTPAEQAEAASWAKQNGCRLVLSGGHPECERKAAFFLPFYVEPETFSPEEYICAMRAEAFFGAPAHRDYMGAILGLGIRREWLGDIWVDDSGATIFCLPGVERHLLDSLDRVGSVSVRVSSVALSELSAPERAVSSVTFSVQSMRLDAVCAGMFHLSRTKAEEAIRLGLVSLNYLPCLKGSVTVREGDTISVRGHGKGTLGAPGGLSKKGRQFVTAELRK